MCTLTRNNLNARASFYAIKLQEATLSLSLIRAISSDDIAPLFSEQNNQYSCSALLSTHRACLACSISPVYLSLRNKQSIASLSSAETTLFIVTCIDDQRRVGCSSTHPHTLLRSRNTSACRAHNVKTYVILCKIPTYVGSYVHCTYIHACILTHVTVAGIF